MWLEEIIEEMAERSTELKEMLNSMNAIAEDKEYSLLEVLDERLNF